MKRIILLVATMMLAVSAEAGAATEIKLAILAPEGTAWHKVMTAWDKELQQKTQGRVKFKIYAGGSMGDEQDIVRKMRIGQVHAAGFTGLGLGIINPAVRVLELPMLVSNYAEADAVTKKIQPKLEKGFDEKGFVFLGWAETGFVNVFSNKPISTLKDMSGMKMWAWEGDQLVAEMYKAFKIVPIPLPITDVLTSLQTKMVDAVYTPPLGAIALQWFTAVKFMSDLKLADSTGGILITKKAFASLSPADQKLLRETGRKFAAELVKQTRSDNEKSYATIANAGIKTVKVDAEEVEKIRATSREVWKALVGKLYSQELLNEAIAAAGK
ncbi:MAG TPA: TRAP transporter substrate-binding protein DctP [bacterium]|nr:TRAP transporter substrate-binding protein DctP [bacterium]